MIGDTPLIKIKYKYKNQENYIYVKLEYYNLTGSIKDRVAEYIINKAKEDGSLKPNQAIIEATSGNTGIALAALGARYNHPVHIFMPDWVSVERKNLMEMFGAHIHFISKDEGGFKTAIKQADQLAEEIDGFRTNQFSNQDNVAAHYNTTFKEILNEVPNIGGFVSGIGTGGTLVGVAKGLKEVDENIKIYALEPKSLPILSQGVSEGSHIIEGIGDVFIPEIVDNSLIDEIVLISDLDAFTIMIFLLCLQIAKSGVSLPT